MPELAAIWRIQRQMVADIAGAYGVSAELTQSRMLYCLFRHAAAQAVRDVAVQVGARLLIQDVPLRVIEKIAAKIGVSVSKRLVGRGIARWLPVIGALGVGAYAYYDTGQVARTAIDLFGATRRRRRVFEVCARARARARAQGLTLSVVPAEGNTSALEFVRLGAAVPLSRGRRDILLARRSAAQRLFDAGSSAEIASRCAAFSCAFNAPSFVNVSIAQSLSALSSSAVVAA